MHFFEENEKISFELEKINLGFCQKHILEKYVNNQNYHFAFKVKARSRDQALTGSEIGNNRIISDKGGKRIYSGSKLTDQSMFFCEKVRKTKKLENKLSEDTIEFDYSLYDESTVKVKVIQGHSRSSD